MFSRKSMFIALTVVMMLAMLVPAAMAAPEWTNGVTITSPTNAAPAYVNPGQPVADTNGDGIIDYRDDGPKDAALVIKADVSIVGTQVDDLDVRARASQNAGSWYEIWSFVYASNSVQAPVTKITSPLLYLTGEGWWNLELCVRDRRAGSQWFCDTEAQAFLIDSVGPGARLLKPTGLAGQTDVTGKDFLMLGKAWDPGYAEDNPLQRYGKIASTSFAYCSYSNFDTNGFVCGDQNQSWITLAAGVPSGVPDEYKASWDSTQVPDGYGYIQFCATDLVGLQACDYAWINVNNRATISLRPGWNLISLPLMPYNSDIDDVLMHLSSANAVASVATYDAGTGTWSKWNANPAVPSDLTEMVDGKGYWVWATTVADLTVVGTWSTTGAGVPPEYPVYESWNLIGYTHWGTPTWGMNKTVYEYLSTNSPAMKAMWAYDAFAGAYYQVPLSGSMSQGAGYWLALAQAGSINP